MKSATNKRLSEHSSSRAHPNRMAFRGVIGEVGRSSQKSPSGAMGHRVKLPKASVVDSIHGLVGMSVNCREDFSGHDPRRKIGVIEDAFISGRKIVVVGYIFALDFADVIRKIQCEASDGLGMSVEFCNARVMNPEIDVWILSNMIFTGAAIVLREKAAFAGTQFRLLEHGNKAFGAVQPVLR